MRVSRKETPSIFVIFVCAAVVFALYQYTSSQNIGCYGMRLFYVINTSCDSTGTFHATLVNFYSEDFAAAKWTVMSISNSSSVINIAAKDVPARSNIEVVSQSNQGAEGADYTMTVELNYFKDGFCGGRLVIPNIRC